MEIQRVVSLARALVVEMNIHLKIFAIEELPLDLTFIFIEIHFQLILIATRMASRLEPPLNVLTSFLGGSKVKCHFENWLN